jgi:hypothetical protein
MPPPARSAGAHLQPRTHWLHVGWCVGWCCNSFSLALAWRDRSELWSLAPSSGCPSCGWDTPMPRPRSFRVRSTRWAPQRVGWLVLAPQWCDPSAGPRPHHGRLRRPNRVLCRSRLRGHMQPRPARGAERRVCQGRNVVAAPYTSDRGCSATGCGEPLARTPARSSPQEARCKGTVRAGLRPSSRVSPCTRLPPTRNNASGTVQERCSTTSTDSGRGVEATAKAPHPRLGDSV